LGGSQDARFHGDLMNEAEELAALAEEIQEGRDTITVPEELIEERPPETKVSVNLLTQIKTLTLGERLKLALKGNRDARTLLLRDANRLVQRFVLLNPRITDEEIISLAKNRNIDSELLNGICRRKEWVSNYQVRLALATNPKTPLGMAVRFVPTLLPRDLRALAKSKNVPAAVNGMAKRLIIGRGG
jgi:hypothetical protein